MDPLSGPFKGGSSGGGVALERGHRQHRVHSRGGLAQRTSDAPASLLAHRSEQSESDRRTSAATASPPRV